MSKELLKQVLDKWLEDADPLECEGLVSAIRAELAKPETAPQPSHSDDQAVDRFAVAMKAKLVAARAKGRCGWDDPEQCTIEHLSELLRGHVGKGDPIDVANFAMMLHQRGSGITPESPQPVEQPAPAQTVCKPMTTVQMEKGRAQIFSVGNPFCPCDSKTFMKVARYVESFHDIKE